MMMTSGKIANEYGEVIGAYWYCPSTGHYTLRLYRVNREGYTEEGIRAWCLGNDCQWWED